MADQVVTTIQFGGDQPALDRKQVAEPYVMEGENYLVDAEGPYATFGQTIGNYTRIEDSTIIQSFQVDDEFFLFTDSVVLRYDANFNSYYPAYVYEQTSNEFYPWTHALVGAVHYFARKGYGIISYNPFTFEWARVSGNGIHPTVYFILEVDGRLVALGEDYYSWSNIDDGTQHTTDISKGTGAQSLALIGRGAPLGLHRTADGFLVSTTNGLIKAESIDAIALSFRHYVLSTDIKPLDQFTVIQFGDDTVLLLTKKGFYTTAGRAPAAFQPLMSEYFTRILFPKINLSIVGLLKLFYAEDRNWLFVSVSENEIPFIYPMAHVLYLTVDKWGRFNRFHKSIGDFNLTQSPLTEDNLGYTCRSTYIRIFNYYPISENPPDYATTVFFTDMIVFSSRVQDGVLHFASFIHMTSIDRNEFPVNNGLYNQATKSPQGADIASIGAYIDVGPYRIMTPEYNAYLNIADYTAIAMRESPEFVEDEDWLTEDGDEDWLALDGPDEDWGFDTFSSTSYKIECLGTLDGYRVFDGQQEELTEEVTENKIVFYSHDTHGMYLHYRVSALEENQSFHLKFLQANLNLGGIL